MGPLELFSIDGSADAIDGCLQPQQGAAVEPALPALRMCAAFAAYWQLNHLAVLQITCWLLATATAGLGNTLEI